MASSSNKPFTLRKVQDTVLGCFSVLPKSETFEHLLRLLGTYGGSDKFFQLVQYSIQVLVPLLHLRAGLQHKYGLSKASSSSVAVRLLKLEKTISGSRSLWRIWGILPIIQWLIALERKPQPTRNILDLERLQGWSMLAFYPLDNLSFLSSTDIIPKTITLPLSSKSVTLNPAAMGTWSCRFWALYIVLQFAHLREDKTLLLQRIKAMRKSRGLTSAERKDIGQKWDAFYNELAVNLANLPLALHWSTSTGLISNNYLVSLLGLVAAIGSWRGAWKATALPIVVTEPVVNDATVSEPSAVTEAKLDAVPSDIVPDI